MRSTECRSSYYVVFNKTEGHKGHRHLIKLVIQIVMTQKSDKQY